MPAAGIVEDFITLFSLRFEMEDDRLLELFVEDKEGDAGADLIDVLLADVSSADVDQEFFDTSHGAGCIDGGSVVFDVHWKGLEGLEGLESLGG